MKRYIVLLKFMVSCGMYSIIGYYMCYSLDGKRIRLDTTDQTQCKVDIKYAKDADSGVWIISSYLCQRDRGKHEKKAMVAIRGRHTQYRLLNVRNDDF